MVALLSAQLSARYTRWNIPLYTQYTLHCIVLCKEKHRVTRCKGGRVPRIKNRAPAAIQITAEQLLREAQE